MTEVERLRKQIEDSNESWAKRARELIRELACDHRNDLEQADADPGPQPGTQQQVLSNAD